jgi:hypothetical protein
MTLDTVELRTRATLLDSQRRVLERIASGAPLEEILETQLPLLYPNVVSRREELAYIRLVRRL